VLMLFVGPMTELHVECVFLSQCMGMPGWGGCVGWRGWGQGGGGEWVCLRGVLRNGWATPVGWEGGRGQLAMRRDLGVGGGWQARCLGGRQGKEGPGA
jgi:hypothetical protein